MTNQSTAESSYFDLHITGLGYLNRIREVVPPKGRKGESFLACDIAALSGPTDKVSYVRFSTRVSGSDAQHLVRRCQEAVKADKKVMIGFKLGDLWSEIYTRTKGDQAGEQAVGLKARLLFISWIKIDGMQVYQAPKKEEEQVATEGPAAPAPQEAAAPEAPEPVTEPVTEPAGEAADEREPALADSF